MSFRTSLAVAMGIAVAAMPATARAFCGFYVSGADQSLYNNATMVVMMREGTKTVLSMQNNYQGPPDGFALVVPVPVVLAKNDVRTLPRAVFQRVDAMASPRLVEYWEQDPCPQPEEFDSSSDNKEGGTGTRAKGEEGSMGNPKLKTYGVKIEAQFDVDEYEILILSAKDSGGLDAWLRDRGYKIPAGAGEVLRPYVASGSKFFVAKVDPEKVRFDGDQAMLSPLRFQYDSDTFTLPIRLGLLNAGPAQDLIVHIFAQKRYEAANYDNVFIPTNLDVADGVRHRYGEFYAALFDRTIASKPRAVVTEYSWDARSCDPCPGPTLTQEDLTLLGNDAMPRASGFVLTRLHARYSKESLGDDLIFRETTGVTGGREDFTRGAVQSTTALPTPDSNFFQARYVIRHAWTGPVWCSDPEFGVWGGPTSQSDKRNAAPKAAQDLAFAPRNGLDLGSLLHVDVPQIGVMATAPGNAAIRGPRASRVLLGMLGGGGVGIVVALGAIGAMWRRRDD